MLNLAEIENRVESGSAFQTLETTYRFHMSNTDTTNQEVIITFEAPSKYSVATELRLGLDGELIGQIAPR